jgi:hypothetical protein
MEATARPPQAPSEPLPELAEFLAPFRAQFRQNNSFHVFERYITGVLTEHPNKNCETMAEVVPGANARAAQPRREWIDLGRSRPQPPTHQGHARAQDRRRWGLDL